MVYILNISSLSKSYGKERILSDINLNISNGEIIGLVGKNGSGKTTLLSIITGLANKDTGDIKIYSYDITDTKKYSAYIRILQSTPAFYEELSGAQNLSIFCSPNKKRKFLEIYSKFEDLKTLKKKFKNFSLGMKRKFAISLVFSYEVPLILLDEPLNGLDHDSITIFEDLMINHKKNGGSAIITTHQRIYMESYCDYFLELKNCSLQKQTQLLKKNSVFYIKSKTKLDNFRLPASENLNVVRTSPFSLQVEGEVQDLSLYVRDLINSGICVIEYKEKTSKQEVG